MKTLVAIVGPGLIVMVGDNDAGAFATYTQAGQNYGTRLLWTLLLLVPVLYVNQEMVLRLGAVTGVGHARLDPGALRQVLGRVQRHRPVPAQRADHRHRVHRDHAGRWRIWGCRRCLGGAGRGGGIVGGRGHRLSFRRFERVCLVLVRGSLLLVPILVMAHPPLGQIAHDFVVPGLPGGGSCRR